MLKQFEQFADEQGLSLKNQKLLVAVSGGVDSMVLVDLLLKSDCSIALAHCNYHLRGLESDKDQKLVEDFARNHGLVVHVKHVDTKAIVAKTNASTQMVARDERYRFFKGLNQEHGYDLTVLAHNADDRIESLLINVLRGTGVRGLQGMPATRGLYARPLLFAKKADIREYASRNQVRFREDASNSEVHYQRNWIRLRVLPMLKQIDADVEVKLLNLAERVAKEIPAYEDFVARGIKDLSTSSSNTLSVAKIQSADYPFTLLRELLGESDFSSNQVFEVIDLLESSSGTFVEKENTRVIKNREELIIHQKLDSTDKPKLTFELIERTEIKSFSVDEFQTLLDADLVKPDHFELRHWQKGDSFKPLGMTGWKKLSDFFIDSKLSIAEKDKVWLLMQNDAIVWVLGMRLDDRFKVTPKTQKVLKITAC